MDKLQQRLVSDFLKPSKDDPFIGGPAYKVIPEIWPAVKQTAQKNKVWRF